ncbi:UNVERIFIED_CONTAM: hypothetical protein PYX00_007825 [Menopon gallinae]|uniref:Peptidase S1 domain-containing protein n=1 Tax=Menopon gallinae TaxID=328185 RepID=A0AAW2HL63_9NEOP
MLTVLLLLISHSAVESKYLTSRFFAYGENYLRRSVLQPRLDNLPVEYISARETTSASTEPSEAALEKRENGHFKERTPSRSWTTEPSPVNGASETTTTQTAICLSLITGGEITAIRKSYSQPEIIGGHSRIISRVIPTVLSGNPKSTNQNSGGTSKRKLLPENTCGIDLPRRILGGTTADIDEFPWLALLQYKNRNGQRSHDCGGALISSRYVVTAAHCTIGLGVTTRKLKLEKVRLGEWDLSTETDCQHELCSKRVQEIDIEEIINHPDYNPRESSQTNDIALLRLRREAETNQFVHPICLPLDDMAKMNFEGKRMSVAGWGRTKNGTLALIG